MSHQFSTGFKSTKQRQVMMILGLLMTPLVLSTTFLFVDSYSLTVWQRETSVGPASIVITGSDAHVFSSQIEQIDGINNTSYVVNSWASVLSLANNTIPDTPFLVSEMAPAPDPLPNINLTAASLSSDLFSEFPTIFDIVDGRHPTSTTEISLLASVANQLSVSVGDTLRYANTTGTAGPGGALFRYEVTLDIVGIYTHSERIDSNPLPYTRGDVIVVRDLLGEISVQSWVYIDVDDSLIDPFSPENTIGTLREIDENIKHLDPNYGGSVYWVRFYLQDLLASGILEYLEWHNSERTGKLIDSLGMLFISLSISYLIVGRYFVKRRPESILLHSRGVSSNRAFVFLAKEAASSGIVSLFLGIGLGFIVTGWGLHPFAGLFEGQEIAFLLKVDAFVVISSLSILCPLLFLFIQFRLSRRSDEITQESGRLDRISRTLSVFRFDLGITLVILLVLVTTSQMRYTSLQVPFLVELLVLMPLLLFVALLNLLKKVAARGSRIMARLLEPIVGKTSSRLGIRNLGTNSGQVVPSIMIIALVTTMLWTSVVMETSSTSSYLSQTRFMIGGDVTFKLDPFEYDNWNLFKENVTSAFPGSQITLLTQQIMFLSTGLEGAASFHAINPEEYSRVGYDHNGIPLENSALAPLLDQLSLNVTGAVVTQDVADEFQLTIGGPLRGFLSNGTDYEVLLFSVIGIVDYLPEVLVQSSGAVSPISASFPSTVGISKVWVNRNYALDIMSEQEATANYLCVRTDNSESALNITNELRRDGGNLAIDRDGVGVSYEMADVLLASESYLLSIAFRNLVDILQYSSFLFLLIPLLDSISDKDKRLVFLLQSIGYDSGNRRKIAASKSFAIFLSTLVMMMLLIPIYVLSSTSIYLERNSRYIDAFPSPLILGDLLSPLLMIIPALLILVLLILVILLRYDKSWNAGRPDIPLGLQLHKEGTV